MPKNKENINNTEEFIKKNDNSKYLKESFYKEDSEYNEQLEYNEEKRINQIEKFVLERETDMTTASSIFHSSLKKLDWQRESNSDIMYDWMRYFNYPLEKSIVAILEWELWERDIVYDVDAISDEKDVNKIRPNTILMDYVYFKDNTSKKAKLFRKNFLKYWVWVIYEWVRIKSKKIRTKWKFDGNFYWNEEQIKVEEQISLNSRVIHPSNFLIDDWVIDFDEANDAIEYEILSKQDVINKYANQSWMIKSKVMKMLDWLTDTDNKVKHYYNETEDIYAIVINEDLIFEWPNPFPHKKLPFSVAVLSESDTSPYGEGWVIKLLNFAKPFINDLFNITIRQSRNANMPPILLWEWADFDWKEHKWKVWNVWKFRGTLDQVKELKVSPPDSSMFNVISRVEDFIVQLIGVDARSLYTKSSKTKFEAWLIEQSKNKRIWTLWKILDYAYSRFLNQRIKNVAYFLPVLLVETIIDWDKKQVKKWNKFLLKDTSINRLENWDIEFETTPWIYSNFELKEEDIRWDFRVNVITEETRPILKEIKKDDVLKVLQESRFIFEAQPEAMKWVDFTWMLEILFGAYDLDVKKILMDSNNNKIQNEIDKLKQNLLQVNQNAWAVPNNWVEWQPTWEESIWQEVKWLTPNYKQLLWQ